jgi:low affinity Fe/Cu permease
MLRLAPRYRAFRQFAHRTSTAAGEPWAFTLAVAVVLVGAVSGPVFGYSDTWQLTINTGTTIITFLMVFVIQNTQNRDSQVVQLKLDELIRAVEHARNELVDMEDLSDEELHRLQRQFELVRKSAEAERRARDEDGHRLAASAPAERPR